MYSDVTGDANIVRTYMERLRETKLDAGIFQFAQINDLLFKRSMDQTLHARLRQTFINPIYQRNIDRLVTSLGSDREPPDAVFIFHRLGALFNLKMLLGRAEDAGVNPSTENALIGDLALLANDIVKLDRPFGDYMSTIVMFLPEWEIDNPPDIGSAVGRFDLMMRKHLAGDDAFVRAKRDELRIDTETVDGIPVGSYAKIVFSIYAAINSAVAEDGSCTFDQTTLAEPLHIPEVDVDTFLAGRSLSRYGFRTKLSGEGWTPTQLEAVISSYRQSTDITMLRRYPLVQLDDRHMLVLDLGFVIDLLSSSMYYTYFNAHGNAFADLWGRVFELYTVDLLGSFYPAPASPIIRPPTVLHAFKQFGDAAGPAEIDAVLDRGRTMIVLEMKSSRLDLNAKLSRDPQIVEREIRRKFVQNEQGAPKALRQLAHSAHAILNGEVPGLHVPEVIYPVLLSEERSFESFEMNAYLNEIFDAQRQLATTTCVKPLTTMSIDELEWVLPLVADETVTWDELLDARFDGEHVRALSVHQALYNIGLNRPLPQRVNTVLRNRFAGLIPELRESEESRARLNPET
jgi:hypothetical protein